MTKVFNFETDNLNDWYPKVLKTIMLKGEDFNFGDKKEIKWAREVFAVSKFRGGSIHKMLKGKMPGCSMFGDKALKELRMSFISKNPNEKGFDYTYPQLLKEYPIYNESSCPPMERKIYNQFIVAKKLLQFDIEDNILSNRNVGVLYYPSMRNMRSKPCFNWFQVRYMGNKKVSLRLLFRSHDYADGVLPNLGSIPYGFNENVFKPSNCELAELILTSTSAHIYEHSSQQVEKITKEKWERTKITRTGLVYNE